MVIKKEKLILCFITVLVIGILLLSFFKLPTIKGSLFEPEDPPIVDKVYTFLAPDDDLVFPEVYLDNQINYYFWIEVVTPHNCTMSISLWDPDNVNYDIFYNNMSQGDWREIPFGVAIQGIYTIKFDLVCEYNLNIYIRLKSGEQCLQEKIPSQLFNRRVFYRITRFSNRMTLSHYVQFDTDVSYRFYSGRVSAISLLNDSEVKIEYYIYDSEDINFQIYYNATLPSVDEIKSFNFGTAKAGVYIINITIHCNVESVNIGYTICWDYRITDPINNTGPPTEDDTDFSELFSLPSEMMTGMIIITGLFIGGLIMLTTLRKRKNIRIITK